MPFIFYPTPIFIFFGATHAVDFYFLSNTYFYFLVRLTRSTHAKMFFSLSRRTPINPFPFPTLRLSLQGSARSMQEMNWGHQGGLGEIGENTSAVRRRGYPRNYAGIMLVREESPRRQVEKRSEIPIFVSQKSYPKRQFSKFSDFWRFFWTARLALFAKRVEAIR